MSEMSVQLYTVREALEQDSTGPGEDRGVRIHPG